ncbi:hypothetical protein NQ315_004013 [Exocentrus adspersus]|uniref:Putative nuclease HARBI1 n=1 Tax=Exocentrus adspersus TaxID=1586481 RepID=A0AAV8V714_9CUCU|nr:hypothetical protein NQ315_004013 [Exocentrus adspersus]
MDPININIFDSDNEDIQDIYLPRHPKVFKNRPNYFDEYDELEFFKRFRLQKHTVQMVLHTIENLIKYPTNRNNAISPATKLFVTLRFYATGSMLIAVGDFAGVSKSSACEIVTNVTEAIITALRERYIKFPAIQADRQIVKEKLYAIARFPHVLGTIDCTHVRIMSPGGNEAERYRNRKGYFSWNVQTICDAQLKIMDIVVRWPGSSHDQTIRRFPILSLGMRVSPVHSQAIIVATAILHNLAIEENEEEPPIEIEVVEDVHANFPNVQHQQVAPENNRMRTSLINNHFTYLL